MKQLKMKITTTMKRNIVLRRKGISVTGGKKPNAGQIPPGKEMILTPDNNLPMVECHVREHETWLAWHTSPLAAQSRPT
jgi:hypothetical protein